MCLTARRRRCLPGTCSARSSARACLRGTRRGRPPLRPHRLPPEGGSKHGPSRLRHPEHGLATVGHARARRTAGMKRSERPVARGSGQRILNGWTAEPDVADPPHPVHPVVGTVRSRLRPAPAQGPRAPRGAAYRDERRARNTGCCRRASSRLASTQPAMTITTPSKAPRTRFESGSMPARFGTNGRFL